MKHQCEPGQDSTFRKSSMKSQSAVMMLTRLPLLAGPTDGERFSGRRGRDRDGQISERLSYTAKNTYLHRLRGRHENSCISLSYITPAVPNLSMLDTGFPPRQTSEFKCVFIGAIKFLNCIWIIN